MPWKRPTANTFSASPSHWVPSDQQRTVLAGIAKYVLARALETDDAETREFVAGAFPHNGGHMAVLTELRFKARVAEMGVGKREANSLWNLMAQGIVEQRELANGRNGPGTGQINRDFERFAQRISSLRLLDPGRNLALWAGGLCISKYARNLGYTCLETSVFGSMFDRARITNYDAAIWALWDYLAEAFVDQVRGRQVHVFVRNFDHKSTLLRTEIPHLLEIQKRKGFSLKWHAIVGDGDDFRDLRALNDKAEPVRETREKQRCFDTMLEAELAQRRYLMMHGRHLGGRDRILHQNKYERPTR